MTTAERILIAVGLGLFAVSTLYWIASFALAVEWWTR